MYNNEQRPLSQGSQDPQYQWDSIMDQNYALEAPLYYDQSTIAYTLGQPNYNNYMTSQDPMHNYYNGAHSEIPTSRKPLNYTSPVVPIDPDINIAPSSFGSYYNQAYAPEAQGYRTSRESATYHDVPMTNGINSLRGSNLYQASDTVPLSSPSPLNNPTLANPYSTSASYADGSAYNRFSTQQMEGPSLNTNDNDPESQFFEGSFRPNVSTTATRRAASYRRKNEAKYVCRHCGTRFTTMRNQQHHEDSHVNAKKYVCSECHLAMATRSNVLRHGRTQHPGLAVYVESRP